MGWTIPNELTRNRERILEDIAELSDRQLMNLHDNLHVMWNKKEEGVNVNWTFKDIKDTHLAVKNELERRREEHIDFINQLDNLEYKN